MVDVVKALAGGEGIVWIDAFKPAYGQKHTNWRTKCKERLRVEFKLGVINGHLWRNGGV